MHLVKSTGRRQGLPPGLRMDVLRLPSAQLVPLQLHRDVLDPHLLKHIVRALQHALVGIRVAGPESGPGPGTDTHGTAVRG